jgi:HSP20 family protein
MDRSFLPFDDDEASTPNSLALDITSDDNNLIIKAALPGVTESDINVQVQHGVLTITAEKHSDTEDKDKNYYRREMHYGRFERSVRLPEEVATDKADAELANGILTISLPKSKPNTMQQIAVKAKKMIKG